MKGKCLIHQASIRRSNGLFSLSHKSLSLGACNLFCDVSPVGHFLDWKCTILVSCLLLNPDLSPEEGTAALSAAFAIGLL
jgi:hypothetical protein